MTLSAQKSIGFDVDMDACSGLTFGVGSGMVVGTARYGKVGPQKVTLQASATNYVEADAYGAVTVNVTAFTSGRNFLYIVATGADHITTIEDWRFNPGVNHPLGQTAVLGVDQAPSATALFSINVSALATDATGLAVGDVYANASVLTVKMA